LHSRSHFNDQSAADSLNEIPVRDFFPYDKVNPEMIARGPSGLTAADAIPPLAMGQLDHNICPFWAGDAGSYPGSHAKKELVERTLVIQRWRRLDCRNDEPEPSMDHIQIGAIGSSTATADSRSWLARPGALGC
jgi:hypothetical protein